MSTVLLQEVPVLGKAAFAKERLLSRRGEPLFYANWDNVLFIHYETERHALQRHIPYPLDLCDSRAFVSLVAFTMRGMRPRFGSLLGTLLFKPIASHHFLNVRTYVRYKGEAGIYFMREWLSSRMAASLGASTFGLPYHFAMIEYHQQQKQRCRGRVQSKEGAFSYHATLTPNALGISAAGSLDEFLLERYTAFTDLGRQRRFFRIWHEPWQQVAAKVDIVADDLICATESWWPEAACVGANFSPRVNVWMGWPHKLAGAGESI